MHIVHVHVHVKPECINEFIEASLENAHFSALEPGIDRFEVIQEVEDPTRFILEEIYLDQEAPARHKETDHYKKWRDAVADMMAEPRRGVWYRYLLPKDGGY